MSSGIYRGLQSCNEPPLMEPRVLSLKLTPSQSNSPPPPWTAAESDLSATHSDPQIETHFEIEESDVAVGGWSFLQALSGVYVHPPAVALTGKSLEMCTESLGSETGSDGSEFGGDEKMSLFSSELETEGPPPSVSGEKSSRFSRLRAKKLAKPSYPPPLTSMSGPMGIKVKPFREGGRLVLKAMSIPSPKPCFEVERGGGRLRLRLLKHCLLSNNLEEEEEEEVEEEKGESNDQSGSGRRRKGRRCKEGGGGGIKELLNWEPFLVST